MITLYTGDIDVPHGLWKRRSSVHAKEPMSRRIMRPTWKKLCFESLDADFTTIRTDYVPEPREPLRWLSLMQHHGTPTRDPPDSQVFESCSEIRHVDQVSQLLL